MNPTTRPHCKLRPVPHTDVRWTGGFWGERFEICRHTMIAGMQRALAEPDNAALLANFAVAAGFQPGRHRGTKWSDGDCYKWLEAVAHVYGATGDAALDELMDAQIAVIGKAQADDGYISTQVQLTERTRWDSLHTHELYNMGHLMTAAAVHHRVTGKMAFLQIAVKLADHLHDVFAPRPVALAHFGFNPSNIMGAVDLYRATGNARYLDLARTFVDMRGSAPGGTDLNQTRTPLREEREAVGHAVTATYLYAGAADLYAETGEPALLEALERIWRNVVERKLYLTGAVGALHHGVSAHRDSVHEAFGLDYQLPNRTGYNETCANIGNAMWNQRMLGITGDAAYADVMERVLYNSALSAMSLDGTRFFYTNPLARSQRMPLLSQDSTERWFTFRCYCCPPQVLRTLAGLHNWAYSVSADGVWIHLYGSSRLATELDGGARIALTQTSGYPWHGAVKVTVHQAPPAELALRLRIPGWADGAAVRVNGRAAAVSVRPGRYAVVRRTWSEGDVLELALPMTPRLVTAHPFVEETRGQTAVVRGPVVYCLESADLPHDVSLWDVRIPRDIALTARYDEELLGGVTLLEGAALCVDSQPPDPALYREPVSEKRRPIDLRLIPYFAWCNRGPGEMSVWLPRA
ncbi:MAG: glycoside hydrolase family 127 protein [Kiritimatiellae bacterium]|nr:glycoside hydrolase family 127 protein [Kiritimatiellia bacterium]